MARSKSTAVLKPNFGLYLDRPAISIPAQGVQDGYNFRIKNGKMNNLNLGWTKFSDQWTLGGPTTFIDNFFPRMTDEQLMFGTDTDIFRYDPVTDEVLFITPTYAVGTASSSGTAVTGVGTDWDPNVKIGDYISFGSATVNDPDATWFLITNRTSDTAITISPSSGVVAAGPYTIRRTFSGTLDDVWSFDTFVQDSVSGDDLWIATNGIEPVISWNGTDPTVTLHPELNFTCKVVTTFTNMMIYQNLIQGGEALPTSIINSDIGKPLDVVSGLSEQFRIHDGTDQILNSIPLGDNLVFYSERHLVMAQFVGDPLVFLFRTAIAGIGAISYNGIGDFGDFHEFAAADAMYVFDGVSVRETNAQVWREIIRSADPVRRRHVYAHFDEESGDLIWSVPGTTDPGVGDVLAGPVTGWAEHYLEEVPDGTETPYSRRAFPFTATGYYEQSEGLTWQDVVGTFADFQFSWNDQFFALGFPLNIAGDVNGQIYIFGNSQTGDGALLPSFVRFGREPTGNGIERNLVTRFYPFATKLSSILNVRVWASDFAAGPTTSFGIYPFDTALIESVFFVSIFRRMRYVEFELNSDGSPWEIWGHDREFAKGGRR